MRNTRIFLRSLLRRSLLLSSSDPPRSSSSRDELRNDLRKNYARYRRRREKQRAWYPGKIEAIISTDYGRMTPGFFLLLHGPPRLPCQCSKIFHFSRIFHPVMSRCMGSFSIERVENESTLGVTIWRAEWLGHRRNAHTSIIENLTNNGKMLFFTLSISEPWWRDALRN